MSNLSFKINEDEKVIEIDQCSQAYVNWYTADGRLSSSEGDYDGSQVEVYLRIVLNPPPGYLVRGRAVSNAMSNITNFRGIDEFTRAFAILHPDERQIDYRFAKACELCNLPVAQFLRGLGANVNGNAEIVPLDRMYSVFEETWPEERKQRFFDVMTYLLSFENLNIFDILWKWDVLGRAIERRYSLDVIEGLLRRGASPNSRGHGLFLRPLCHAADQNNFQLVELLLRYGADPKIPDIIHGLPRNCTQDPAIRVLLDSHTPTFQLFYCLQQSGVTVDVETAFELVNYDPYFTSPH